MGDFAKEEFSKEELEALGEAGVKVDDKKKTDEGAGKSPEEIAAEAAAKADEVERPWKLPKPRMRKNPSNCQPKEKEVADQEGVKLIRRERQQYLVDDEGAKIPVERWRKNFARTQAEVDSRQTRPPRKRTEN